MQGGPVFVFDSMAGYYGRLWSANLSVGRRVLAPYRALGPLSRSWPLSVQWAHRNARNVTRTDEAKRNHHGLPTLSHRSFSRRPTCSWSLASSPRRFVSSRRIRWPRRRWATPDPGPWGRGAKRRQAVPEGAQTQKTLCGPSIGKDRAGGRLGGPRRSTNHPPPNDGNPIWQSTGGGGGAIDPKADFPDPRPRAGRSSTERGKGKRGKRGGGGKKRAIHSQNFPFRNARKRGCLTGFDRLRRERAGPIAGIPSTASIELGGWCSRGTRGAGLVGAGSREAISGFELCDPVSPPRGRVRS